MPLGKKGFQKGVILFKGKRHPNWKGGKPICADCGRTLSSYKAKRCSECKGNYLSMYNPLRGKHIQTNTGRTHFKKGFASWNKGIPCSEKLKKRMSEKRKGISMPKPQGFSETMRRVKPPKGMKMTDVGYRLVYYPNHFGSIDKTGYIAEHRYVLEMFLKRKLQSSENVHHLNGDKGDNRIENLVLCQSIGEHNKIHHKMQATMYQFIKEGMIYYDGENFKVRENNKN